LHRRLVGYSRLGRYGPSLCWARVS
jgi:hypothetical protein